MNPETSPDIEKFDPDWIRELAEFIDRNKNLNQFNNRLKLFRDLYLEYINDGMKPGDALEKAKTIIVCFSS